MKSLVIVPSIRNPNVISDYVKNAEIHNFNKNNLFFLILTEDFVDKSSYESQIRENNVEGLVLNQSDREKFLNDEGLSDFKDLIPRRSHAETSFGLIYLWLNKEFEYGFMIDDDTEPENQFDFFGDHIRNLNYSGNILEVSSNKGWVNVLYQNFQRHKLYPRGYPYSKMGEVISTRITNIKEGDVWISQGLWTNIPDLDAVRILMDGDLNGQAKTRLFISDFKENFVVAKNNFLTVCSMNLAFRREVVPFFYQYPMDDNPWKIGRFDDIWSGVVAKKILDSVGKYIITGFPLCRHNKSPRNTFKDINAEVPGYEANETISDLLMNLSLNSNIFESTLKIAETFQNSSQIEFIQYCGKKLQKWVNIIYGKERIIIYDNK